jgi:hypothetical protein
MSIHVNTYVFILKKKRRGKESLLLHVCLDVLDSKVFNAIRVSLNLCYAASCYFSNSVFWSFEASKIDRL